MHTTRFIFILLGALILGSSIAALLLFSNNAQTQVVTGQQDCVISSVDQDGDCVLGDLDYYPYDASR